jgi:hypothetical protein
VEWILSLVVATHAATAFLKALLKMRKQEQRHPMRHYEPPRATAKRRRA